MRGPFNGCDMPEKIPNRFKIAIFLLSLAPIAYVEKWIARSLAEPRKG